MSKEIALRVWVDEDGISGFGVDEMVFPTWWSEADKEAFYDRINDALMPVYEDMQMVMNDEE